MEQCYAHMALWMLWGRRTTGVLGGGKHPCKMVWKCSVEALPCKIQTNNCETPPTAWEKHR